MTFYDEYTKDEFAVRYGRQMHEFVSNGDDPDQHPEESEFLVDLIGEYTKTIREYVLAVYPDTRFEVLYPHDVNNFPLTRAVNYPDSDWTPQHYEILKTENFTYTGDRDLDSAKLSIGFPYEEKGFTVSRSAHLIGVFHSSEPWKTERRMSLDEGIESVVLWAFDQFSMIGYPLPLGLTRRRSRFIA